MHVLADATVTAIILADIAELYYASVVDIIVEEAVGDCICMAEKSFL